MPEDPEALADDLDRQAAELLQRTKALGKGIDDARSDWENKRADPAVPGAQPRRAEDAAAAPDQTTSAATVGDPEDPPAATSPNPGASPVEPGP